MKIVMLIFFTLMSLKATTINELVALALQNNPNLEIFLLKKDTFLLKSQKDEILDDPIVGVGANDISFKKPFKRSIEPMQNEYINITQMIPSSKKLDLKSGISLKDANIESIKFEDAKMGLRSQILDFSYQFLVVKKKISLIRTYIKNLKKMLKIANFLYRHSKIDQLKILDLKSQLEYKKLNLHELRYKKEEILSKIKELSFVDIDDIQDSLRLKDVNIDIDKVVSKHPQLKILKQLIDKKELEKDLEDEKKNSDIRLSAGYYHRSGFDDYASINAAFALKLSNRENISKSIKKIEKTTLLLKLKDKKYQMKKKIENLLELLKSAKKRVLLIDKSLFKINKNRKKVLNIKIENEKASTLSIYENKNRYLSLKLLKLAQKLIYFRAYSKLSYYLHEDQL